MKSKAEAKQLSQYEWLLFSFNSEKHIFKTVLSIFLNAFFIALFGGNKIIYGAWE